MTATKIARGKRQTLVPTSRYDEWLLGETAVGDNVRADDNTIKVELLELVEPTD